MVLKLIQTWAQILNFGIQKSCRVSKVVVIHRFFPKKLVIILAGLVSDKSLLIGVHCVEIASL
jgi:hypothetical protein